MESHISSIPPPRFHLFPQLPTELKLRIYRLALTPRAVPVCLKLDLDAWNWSTEKDWWTCYAVVADSENAPMPLPGVVSARYEAWAELRRLYRGLKIDRVILESLMAPQLSFSAKREADAEVEGNMDEAISLDTESLPDDPSSSNSDRDDVGGGAIPTANLVKNLLSPEQEKKRPPFNRDHDILTWMDTHRWVSCGDAQLQTLVHPLFLASCLSVRRVSIEYTPCMANLLEVLAFSVLDKSRPLEALDMRVRNPSDCRMLRFRICRVPEVSKVSGERDLVGKVMEEEEEEEEEEDGSHHRSSGGSKGIEEMVKRWGLVWFPWARGDVYRNTPSRLERDDLVQRALEDIVSLAGQHNSHQAHAPPESSTKTQNPLLPSSTLEDANTVAILQVISRSDPTTGPGASGTWARARALADPAAVKYQYPRSEEPLSFGTGNLQTDILLWCHSLKLHGSGYPANLPFNIVGVPCHGFCDDGLGMGW